MYERCSPAPFLAAVLDHRGREQSMTHEKTDGMIRHTRLADFMYGRGVSVRSAFSWTATVR
jgi:hypothetical protein